MKSIAQLEYADTFAEKLPAKARIEQLFHDLRGKTITVNTKRAQCGRFDHRFADTEAQFADYRNELSGLLRQAEKELAEINRKIDDTILEAAEVIKAERGTDCMNCEKNAAEDAADKEMRGI